MGLGGFPFTIEMAIAQQWYNIAGPRVGILYPLSLGRVDLGSSYVMARVECLGRLEENLL